MATPLAPVPGTVLAPGRVAARAPQCPPTCLRQPIRRAKDQNETDAASIETDSRLTSSSSRTPITRRGPALLRAARCLGYTLSLSEADKHWCPGNHRECQRMYSATPVASGPARNRIGHSGESNSPLTPAIGPAPHARHMPKIAQRSGAIHRNLRFPHLLVTCK